MSIAPVARRYANALLQIGVERGNYERLNEQLSAVAKAYADSHEFRSIMLNPSVGIDERKAILTSMAQKYTFDPIAKNFLLLLLDKDRFRFVEDIAHEFGRLSDERAGRIRASVTSATPIDAASQLKIRQRLQTITGAKQVELSTEVDPALLGGVVTRVGGMVLDGSVKTQLESMRASILESL